MRLVVPKLLAGKGFRYITHNTVECEKKGVVSSKHMGTLVEAPMTVMCITDPRCVLMLDSGAKWGRVF